MFTFLFLGEEPNTILSSVKYRNPFAKICIYIFDKKEYYAMEGKDKGSLMIVKIT